MKTVVSEMNIFSKRIAQALVTTPRALRSGGFWRVEKQLSSPPNVHSSFLSSSS